MKDDNNIFHYTGMGLVGEQRLDYAQNKTLAHSKENGIEVHLFEVFEPKKYVYQGVVELADDPYQEEQFDKNGNLRNVWIFPLKLRDYRNPVTINEEQFKAREIARKQVS
ncbi:MAG: hypothetical protein HPY70_14435 [Firmicutes bacterium]|nr:hypothetical protein [Bacillota bacterium]